MKLRIMLITSPVDNPVGVAIRYKWGGGLRSILIESKFEDEILTIDINTEEIGRESIADFFPSDPKKVSWSHLKSKIMVL